MHERQRTAATQVSDFGSPSQLSVSAPGFLATKTISAILLAAMLANAAIVLVALPKVGSAFRTSYSVTFGDLYDLIARNLDMGNGYRVEPGMGNTMLREPGYPVLLAVVFKFAGYGLQQARVACVVLALGAALLLLRLARKITNNPLVALVAAMLFLLYPGILVAEARAGVEIPSIFTVLLFMCVLHSAVESRSLWRYSAAGLLLGLAVLVRSEVLLFPSILLLCLALMAKGWSERWMLFRGFVVLGLGALLVMSPWIIRNYLLVHELVPTATVTGVAAQEGLYTCECSGADPFSVQQTNAGIERMQIATQLGAPFTGPYYQLFYTPQDEVAFNHALLKKVSSEYRRRPALFAKCAAKNLFFNFWFLGKRPQSALLNVVLQAPLLALAVAGVVILCRRRLLPKAAIILLYIVYIPAVHAPIIAHARHCMLIVPFLVILAAVSLVTAFEAMKARDSQKPFHESVAAA